MNREPAFIKMLEASANMQYNISIILETQADEAEKSRNWICGKVHAASFQHDHDHQLKQSVQVHEQIISLIAGLAKLENSLARNLKVVLNQDEDGGFGDMMGGGLDSGLGGLFGQGDDL